MAPLFFLALILANTGLTSTAQASPDLIDIEPGKRLGQVSIGMKQKSLIKQGFTSDTDRDQSTFVYLKKSPLHARLENDRVVEIWIENIQEHWSSLRYQGKTLPTKKTSDELSKFFGNCTEPKKGSGGLLISCAQQGLQISTSFGREEMTLSVLERGK